MAGEELIDQIVNDLYKSKQTREDVSNKYHIPKTNAGLIFIAISQDPEILRSHHVLMVEKSANKINRGRAPNTYYLTPIPLVIQIFDLTLGISLLNFKDFFLKYESYLNFSSIDADFDIALENSASYLDYETSYIQNQLLKNSNVIVSNISPFFYVDTFERIVNEAYKIQEPDKFLVRYFIRQKGTVIEICKEFYNSVDYWIQSASDLKKFPIFELQTGIKYLSWAIRYFKNTGKDDDIYLTLLQISEQLFILLFIPPEQQDSLSVEHIDISNNTQTDLIKNLKVLGIEAKNAIVLNVLLQYDEVPISKFYLTSSLKKKEQIEETLNNLIENDVIISYNKKTSQNRVFTYYKLNKSPQQIFEYLELIIKNNNKKLVDLFESKNWGKFDVKKSDEIIQSLTIIGIDNNAAQILVYLHLNPQKPGRTILQKSGIASNVSLTQLLRKLYEANWIIAQEIGNVLGQSDSRYSLSMPLYDIVLEYLINHLEKTKHSLDELKEYFSILENNTPVISDEVILHPEEIQEKGYQIFVDSLKPTLISHSNFKDQSFVVELKPPHPDFIRVYLTDMRLSLSKDFFTTRVSLGHKRGETWNFNTESVSYILFCGYIVELDIYILFDSSLYRDIPYYKVINVPASAVYEAMVNPESLKVISNNNEILIIVPPEKLSLGLEKRYEIYVQQLISG